MGRRKKKDYESLYWILFFPIMLIKYGQKKKKTWAVVSGSVISTLLAIFCLLYFLAISGLGVGMEDGILTVDIHKMMPKVHITFGNDPGGDAGSSGQKSNEASVIEVSPGKDGVISPEITGELIVHYIDVGQGDSTLIQFPDGKVGLIDTGSRSARESLIDYLDSHNITEIDFFILTHPHEDHIGGAPDIIRKYEIGTVYMPNKIANTKIFEETLKAINLKDIPVIQTKGGMTIHENGNLKFHTLAPNADEYNNTNNYSIVAKLDYGESSFLFEGDAEKESEEEMIRKGYDLTADVLKLGHHGSSTSTTEEFLATVDPSIAIASCGNNNKYGHPNIETVHKLEEKDITLLRTDHEGSIQIRSDGAGIYID